MPTVKWVDATTTPPMVQETLLPSQREAELFANGVKAADDAQFRSISRPHRRGRWP